MSSGRWTDEGLALAGFVAGLVGVAWWAPRSYWRAATLHQGHGLAVAHRLSLCPLGSMPRGQRQRKRDA